MLQALAHRAGGDLDTALGVLGQALTGTPEPDSHVRLFVDEGAPMLELLRDAAEAAGPARSARDGAGLGPSAARTGRSRSSTDLRRSSPWPTR